MRPGFDCRGEGDGFARDSWKSPGRRDAARSAKSRERRFVIRSLHAPYGRTSGDAGLMDRSYGRPAAVAESTPPGVSDSPPPAQAGNGKNGPCIGGMAPGAAGRVLREVFGFEGSVPARRP